MDFIYFLGRFHVLALHLPIGIILAAVVLELLSRREKYRNVEPALSYLWAGAAITAIGTVVLGFMHFAEGGFEGASADAHRIYGTSVAAVATLIWVLRTKGRNAYGKVQIPAAALLVFLVTMTGHYGGNLTHGSTYLAEYAPAPLRTLAGLEPAVRGKVTDLAMADAYLDLIRPMLESRCGTCHNDEKRRGKLSLADYASMLKGGESGPAISAGNAAKSELYRRITLPADHGDFMPADGKTPLTGAQISIIGWWIDAGAATGTTLAGMEISGDVLPLITAELGLSGPVEQAMIASAADPQVIDGLYQAGFVVRQLAQDNPLLTVSVYSPGQPLTDGQLAALSSAADQIAELDLQRAGIVDQDLEKLDLKKFGNLYWLRLNNNRLSDAGVRHLVDLPRLQYLNLNGNSAISDASLETFSSMPALQKLYLWQTGTSAEALGQL